MKKLFSALMILSLATACAFSGANDENKAYQDDRQKLLNDFAPVTGTYSGVIEVAGSTMQIPLELSAYVDEMSNGKDSNGQANILPVLKFRYRQMDTVRPDETLEVRYIKETGDLMAAPDKNTIPNGTTSLNGRLDGQVIRGDVKRSGGYVGKFTVNLVSKDPSSPVDSVQDYVKRKFELYKSLEGTYEGKVTRPPGSDKKDFPVRIQMTAVPVVTNGKVTDVNLKGLYRRPDFTADPSAGERNLDISYSLDTNPAQLVMSSKGGTNQIPDAYTMNIIGTIDQGHFEGEAYDRFGPLGHMVLNKKVR